MPQDRYGTDVLSGDWRAPKNGRATEVPTEIGMVVEEVTTDFMYVRLHGDTELYASGYSEAALDRWADKVRAWDSDGLDVLVYFDNDIKVHAPFDAIALQERLGLTPS